MARLKRSFYYEKTMKNIPVPVEFVKKKLPKDRKYTEVEAMVLLCHDQQTKNIKTWGEYAKTFSWARNTVKSFVRRNKMYFDHLLDNLLDHQIANVTNDPQGQLDKQLDRRLTTHKMQIYIAENYEQVSKLKLQLTKEQCNDLLSKYTKEVIIEKLDNMENKKDLLNKYSSVYRTLISWLKKDNTGNDSVYDRADRLLQYCKKFHPGDNEGLIAMIKASKVNKDVKAYALNKC